MLKALFLSGLKAGAISPTVPLTWPGEREVFWYRPEDRGAEPCWEGGQFDAEILERARAFEPDLVVYISTCPHPTQPLGGIPSPDTFRGLRALAPVLHLCSDGGCEGWRDVLLQYRDEDRFDGTVTIDGCRDWPLKDEPQCWAALTPVPWPAEVAVQPLAERPVPFSFVGESGGSRKELTAALQSKAGLKAEGRGGAYVDYCRRLAESRVTLNCAWSGSGSVKHVKGRVVEAALAGCCLLETAFSRTAGWFVPCDEDYAEYATWVEAKEKAESLLADLPKAQAMADRLRGKIASHSPAKFWAEALERLKVKAQ